MIRGRRYVGAAAAVAVGIIGASVAVGGADAEGWLHAARYTARWSFVVFLAAFLGPVLIRGLGEARTRAAILAFGAVHGIHFGALATYRAVLGEIPPTTSLIVGGLAYALIVVLMIAELLNKSGRVLRSVALHYALLVFVLTYASRLNSADQHWIGVIGVGAGGAAFLIRAFVTLRNRETSRRTQSVP